MGEDHLYMPVLRGTTVALDELPSNAFIGGAPCTSL
jgi:hypothetical protein